MPPRSSAMRSFFHILCKICLLRSDKLFFIHCCCCSLHRSWSTSRLCYTDDHQVKSQPEEPRTAWTSQIPCQRPCPDPYHGRLRVSCPSVPAHPFPTSTLHCSFPQRVSNLLGPSLHPSKADADAEDSTSAPVSHFPRRGADPLQAAAQSRRSLCSSRLVQIALAEHKFLALVNADTVS